MGYSVLLAISGSQGSNCGEGEGEGEELEVEEQGASPLRGRLLGGEHAYSNSPKEESNPVGS